MKTFGPKINSINPISKRFTQDTILEITQPTIIPTSNYMSNTNNVTSYTSIDEIDNSEPTNQATDYDVSFNNFQLIQDPKYDFTTAQMLLELKFFQNKEPVFNINQNNSINNNVTSFDQAFTQQQQQQQFFQSSQMNSELLKSFKNSTNTQGDNSNPLQSQIQFLMQKNQTIFSNFEIDRNMQDNKQMNSEFEVKQQKQSQIDCQQQSFKNFNHLNEIIKISNSNEDSSESENYQE